MSASKITQNVAASQHVRKELYFVASSTLEEKKTNDETSLKVSNSSYEH